MILQKQGYATSGPLHTCVCSCVRGGQSLAQSGSCSALDRWVTRAEGWMKAPHQNADPPIGENQTFYTPSVGSALRPTTVTTPELTWLSLCSGNNWQFAFNVKFYPPDPSLLTEDITRYTRNTYSDLCLVHL